MKKMDQIQNQIFQDPQNPAIQLEPLRLLEQVDPDPENPTLVAEVVALYLTESKKLLSVLQQAIEKKDFLTVEKNAHSLKSSSASVGALRVAKISENLETEAHAQNSSSVSALAQKLRQEFDFAEIDLQALLKT